MLGAINFTRWGLALIALWVLLTGLIAWVHLTWEGAQVFMIVLAVIGGLVALFGLLIQRKPL